MPHVLTNVRSLEACDGRGPIDDAALAWDDDGRLVFVGRAVDLPPLYRSATCRDARGALVVPGLVDCHTHLGFAGWRADEFGERCRGATYAEIAARGGGIAKTVRLTRDATEGQLTERARGFLSQMLQIGIITVECKSGYGLTLDEELKLLRVYRRLKSEFRGTLVSTFLGAHVVPPEYREDRGGYVDSVCERMIPTVAAERLAEFCDVFVEQGAFTPDEARRIFAAAKNHKLRPKLHADQLVDGGGAALAAEVGAISADHLEYANDCGLKAMAEAGTIAVLLPIATLYLRQPPLDARRCFAAGVDVAVATDFNPGSAPSFHLPFAMTLACTMNRMTPQQALLGATIVAARAIGVERDVGSLEVGKRADFILLDAESVEHWLYYLRATAVTGVYVRGERVAA